MSCFDTACVIGQSREPVPPANTIPRIPAGYRTAPGNHGRITDEIATGFPLAA
jgi:hypothetical protein